MSDRHCTTQTADEAAYHEAGHAVIALLLGLNVSSVGLTEDEHGVPVGWCDSQVGTKWGMGVEMGTFPVARTLAGVVAQRIYNHQPDLGCEPDSIIKLIHDASLDDQSYWQSDAQNANTIAYGAVEMVDEDMVKLIVRAWKFSEEHLHRLWTVVKGLAEALLLRRELTSLEINAIVETIRPEGLQPTAA